MSYAVFTEEPEVVTLALSDVRTDGGTQARVGNQKETIEEYAELLRSGVSMPPGVVFYDGEFYWLADGFQRYFGAKEAEYECYDFEVHQGTVRDAILFAVGANAAHGLKRTREDKRNAVMMLLSDPDWRTQTDRWIAEQCNVSHHLVATVRAGMTDEGDADEPQAESGSMMGETEIGRGPRKRTGKDGRKYQSEKPCKSARPNEMPADDQQDEAPDWSVGEKSDDQERHDKLDQPLTDTNKPAFALVNKFKELLSTINNALKEVQKLCVSPAGAFISETRVVTDLRNAREALKVAIPFANCPQCQGEGCRDCKKSGFLTKLDYDNLPKI